jgi:hypothetical protein
MSADRFHAIRHALRHSRVLAADGWYTPADSASIAPTDREFISACDPVTVGTLLTDHDELLNGLHSIGLALRIPADERSPMSLTCAVLEMSNKLARIEREGDSQPYAPALPDWLTRTLRHQGAASLQRLCMDAGHHVDYPVISTWLESIGWCEADITARAKGLIKTDDGSEAW